MSVFKRIAEIKNDNLSQLRLELREFIDGKFKSYQEWEEKERKFENIIKSQEPQVDSLGDKEVTKYFKKYTDESTSHFQWYKRNIIKEVFEEINATYNLSISRANDCLPKNFNSPSELVNTYFRLGDIKSIVLTSEEKTKNDFKGLTDSWRDTRRILQKNRIELLGICYFYRDSEYDSSLIRKMQEIKRALLLFETGKVIDKVDISCKFDVSPYTQVCFEEQFFGSSNRVSSIKIFKNGKIILKFPTPTLASEFWEFCYLDKPMD